MNPSNLPWWSWLLGVLGSLVLGLIFKRLSSPRGFGRVARLLAIFFWLATLVTAVTCLVRFIKWKLLG
jgi:hypothetical protein